MSKESATSDPVELTRRIIEAADRADFDAILAHYARDAVWNTRGAGSFVGVEAIRALWEDYYGAYEELQIEAEEILDFGGGVVLAVNRQSARPVGSTGHVRVREAFLYEWVDGVIVRVTNYGDLDEGRAAAERLAEPRA